MKKMIRIPALLCIVLGLLMSPYILRAQDKKFMSKEEIKDLILHPNKPESIEGQQKRTPPIPKDQIPALEDVLGKKNFEKLKEKKERKEQEEDVKEVLPAEVEQKKGVDYRYRDTPSKQQFSAYDYLGRPRGTCTAFGLASVLENFINNPKVANLSERHIWDHYEVASMDEAIAAARTDYTTEEEYWPQSSTSPKSGYMKYAHTRVKSDYEIGESINKALEYLDLGKPVFLGFSTPSDMYDCKAVVKSNSNTGGGHAVAIVGYQLDSDIPNSGYFIVKNSWGRDCGDSGYHYLPFSFCKAYNNYCYMYAIEDVETKYPSVDSEPIPPVEPTVTPEPPTDEPFDSDAVKMKFEVYKKWYSSYRTVYLYISSPRHEKEMIESIKYTLVDSSISPAVVSDPDTDFEWSFTTQRRSYQVEYLIKLFDGRTISKKHYIEY